MEQNKIYQAVDGDILEIIHNKYFHEVIFESNDSKKDRKRTLSKTVESNGEEEEEKIVPESKIIKLDQEPMTPTTEETWEEFDSGKLFVLTTKGVKGSSKVCLFFFLINLPTFEKQNLFILQIASYDIDGTLITTKSGRVFPKDINDWQIAFPETPGKLKLLHNEGYKIVFITNQAGVASGKLKITDFKQKLQRIIQKFNVPVQAFISTGKGWYRKPMTGMWDKLCEKNDGIEIDKMRSFYIGDAAGRPEKKVPKRKKDHSCSDRLMAINIGIPFFTPEQHFQKSKDSEWVKPEFDPKTVSTTQNLYEPITSKLTSDKTEVIIMVGGPGSGKSNFSRNELEPKGYMIINRDKLGTWQKCVSALESALRDKKHAVVDNTNIDADTRKRYIDVAKSLKIPVRCFLMNTSYKHAKHNIIFRELTDPSHVPVNDMVINSLKSKYQEPTLKEGFSEILKINFIPNFKNEKEEMMYKKFLFDK